MTYQLHLGNSLEVLKTLPDNSVDAIVTDPPYELGFMGKKWDASGIAYNVDLWRECLRVLKHGGHLLAFGGTRTYHRMAVAIEDAGFEVRDMLEWIYASGFPKSLDVGKAYDKLQGNKREHLGIQERAGRSSGIMGKEVQITRELSKGSSPYEGLGTATKPAHEPICMARKPLSEKTIVENVIKHGTGAIEIDGCRVPCTTEKDLKEAQSSRPSLADKGTNQCAMGSLDRSDRSSITGRFPANVLCSDDALNDGVMTKSQAGVKNLTTSNIYGGNALLSSATKGTGEITGFSDQGSKSRYFDIDAWAEKHGLLQYPKASKKDRNEGCEGLELGVSGVGALRDGGRPSQPRANSHPTVKPTHLMAYLVRLVSREGQTVLDPFMGSGTTGKACMLQGRNFIGIELNEEYLQIAEARIRHQEDQEDN